MPRATLRTDFFRACLSGAISFLLVFPAGALLLWGTDVEPEGPLDTTVVAYVVFWPVYGAIYVGWSLRAYGRLGGAELNASARRETREQRRWYQRLAGYSGTTDSTITAAIMAVVVTLLIAQREQFREDPVYVVLALLTVASSWVLLVFAFAQAYLRLAASSAPGEHLSMPFTDSPRFGDYVVLAVLMSTMAATVSARFSSRSAWRLAGANVVIAFVFNSVIIAMMVSLLFGGLGG